MSSASPRVDELQPGGTVTLRNTDTGAEAAMRVTDTGDPMTLLALGDSVAAVIDSETGYELVWPSHSYIVRLPWRLVSSSGDTLTGRADGEAVWKTQRAEPRSAISVPVRLYATGRIIKGTSLDLSAGGARLSVPADVPLGPGDTVRARLSLPDRDLNGQVEVLRRMQDVGADTVTLACRFLEMKQEHRATLRRLCQRMLSLDPSTAPSGANRPRSLTQSLVDRLTRG